MVRVYQGSRWTGYILYVTIFINRDFKKEAMDGKDINY